MTNKRFFLNVLTAMSCCMYVVNGAPKIKTSDSKYSFNYFKREDWGAKPSLDVRPLKKPVPYVVIHHTYKPDACNTTRQCFDAMNSMQEYHNSMGWGDIGYNFCVGSMGSVFEGRGWDNVGIHAGRANSYSIGICLIGDWRVSPPPNAMLKATKKLISMGVANGSVSRDYTLVGHKQIMATECPGMALFDIISTWDHFTNETVDFTTISHQANLPRKNVLTA